MEITTLLFNTLTSSIIAFLTIYTILLILFNFTYIQRFAIYANKIRLPLGADLDHPEGFGFMKGQVIPFRVKAGKETLFAWLITPLSLYCRNEDKLLNDKSSSSASRHDVTLTQAFKLLTSNPQSRVVVYFHGNAGTLAEARRCDAYRVVATGPSSELVHVVTFDYRGFGKSSGSPTEAGLIEDAVSVIEWVMNVAKIPPERILLLAQSLGTAVAAATAAHFINRERKIEFAGVVLCAGFYDAATVFLEYSIAGFVRIMAPVGMLPWLKAWFKGLVVDTWETRMRVQELVKRSGRLRLTFVHARDDALVPYHHSEMLFELAINAAEKEDGKGVGPVETMEMGHAGEVAVWKHRDKLVRKEIVNYGGHDSIMKWNAVIFAVYRSFGLDQVNEKTR